MNLPETTEAGQRNSAAPPAAPPSGLAGKWVVIGLLLSIVVSVVLGTPSYWQYQRLNVAVDQVSADWRKVAQNLEQSYLSLDSHIEKVVTSGKVKLAWLDQFDATRKRFRSISDWNTQQEIAARIESQLQDSSLQTALAEELSGKEELQRILELRADALSAWDSYQQGSLKNYEAQRHSWLSAASNLLMNFPAPPDLQLSQWQWLTSTHQK